MTDDRPQPSAPAERSLAGGRIAARARSPLGYALAAVLAAGLVPAASSASPSPETDAAELEAPEAPDPSAHKPDTRAADAPAPSEAGNASSSAAGAPKAPVPRDTRAGSPPPRGAPPARESLGPLLALRGPSTHAAANSRAAAAQSRASAAQSAPPADDGTTEAPGGKSTKGPGGGKKKISLDEFLVEGQLEKPSAYYILRRSQLEHDWARLDARFSPLVLESVQDPLF